MNPNRLDKIKDYDILDWLHVTIFNLNIIKIVM